MDNDWTLSVTAIYSTLGIIGFVGNIWVVITVGRQLFGNRWRMANVSNVIRHDFPTNTGQVSWGRGLIRGRPPFVAQIRRTSSRKTAEDLFFRKDRKQHFCKEFHKEALTSVLEFTKLRYWILFSIMKSTFRFSCSLSLFSAEPFSAVDRLQ